MQDNARSQIYGMLQHAVRPGAPAAFKTGPSLVTSTCLPYRDPATLASMGSCSLATSTCSRQQLKLQGGSKAEDDSGAIPRHVPMPGSDANANANANARRGCYASNTALADRVRTCVAPCAGSWTFAYADWSDAVKDQILRYVRAYTVIEPPCQQPFACLQPVH
jgi:hypothetical protein